MEPAANTQPEVECSLNLVEKAIVLLDFLGDVDQVPELYSNKKLLRNAPLRILLDPIGLRAAVGCEMGLDLPYDGPYPLSKRYELVYIGDRNCIKP